MGITSAIAGLLTAALPRGFALSTRMVVFPLLLLVFVLPLVAIGVSGALSLWLLCGAVVVAGMAVAPTLITALTIGERAVPLSRVSWAMTVMSSGVVLGYATAALFGGLLAQAHGAIGAFTVTCAAVACAVLWPWSPVPGCSGCRHRERSRRRRPGWWGPSCSGPGSGRRTSARSSPSSATGTRSSAACASPTSPGPYCSVGMSAAA